MKNSILITIIVAVIVAAGAFFAGMKYQQSKSPRIGDFQRLRNGQLIQRGQDQGFRPVNGEIISQDEKSITVKLADGSSKIVLLTDTTAISKSAEGSKSDLNVGEKIAAFGTENSDGSVTAQNIQLNPEFKGPNQNGTPN